MDCCLFILYLLWLEYDRTLIPPPPGEPVRWRSSHPLPSVPADKDILKEKRNEEGKKERKNERHRRPHPGGNFPTSVAARKSSGWIVSLINEVNLGRKTHNNTIATSTWDQQIPEQGPRYVLMLSPEPGFWAQEDCQAPGLLRTLELDH